MLINLTYHHIVSKLTQKLSATSVVKLLVSVRRKNRAKNLHSKAFLSLGKTIELINNLLNTTFEFQLV